MIFTETPLVGSFVIDIERLEDERGFFARTWCRNEFKAHGIETRLVQCNVSFNRRRGTLRGMHFQGDPHAEAKLVRCASGSIHDVIVDIRLDSPTYLHHFAVELSAKNHRMLFIPAGFAHGFQTLDDEAEVLYHMSEFFYGESAGGLRYDDVKLGIHWPLPVSLISEKDRLYPLLP